MLAERRGAAELLTFACRLGSPVAAIAGEVNPATVATLGRFGAHQVFAFGAGDAVAALVELAGRLEPAAILIGACRTGNEVAGRVAVRLKSGIVTNAVDVKPGPVAVREVEYRVTRGIPVFTVQTGLITATPAPERPSVAELSVPPRATETREVARVPRQREPEMSTAPIVVAGGHGIGSPGGFSLVDEVAAALGGETAGSHTAAELGWCPRQRQVDQVGAIVHPRLYFALGISGSVRHRAGMQHAETIVAINRDPTAPIFQIADFGVVGDLHQVVPAFLSELGRRRRQQWCGDSSSD